MKLHISAKNTKLGSILNISLPPWKTCECDAPCREKCYARKAYAGYARSTCGPAWDRNLAAYEEDPEMYFATLVNTLYKAWKHGHRFFRWHVGGDIPDERYWNGMNRVACNIPSMFFLVYTRRAFAMEPPVSNLQVLRSVWLGEGVLQNVPYFKVVPKGTFNAEGPKEDQCPGKCDQCYRCWKLQPGEGMRIELH